MHIFTGSLTPRFSLALIAPPLSVRSCWSSSPGLHGSWFSWASFFSSGRFFQVHSLKLAFKTQVIPSWVFRRTTVSSVLGANTFKLKLFYSSDNSQVKQTSLVQEVKRFFKGELPVYTEDITWPRGDLEIRNFSSRVENISLVRVFSLLGVFSGRFFLASVLTVFFVNCHSALF